MASKAEEKELKKYKKQFKEVYGNVEVKPKTKEDIAKEQALVDELAKETDRERAWRLTADLARVINPYIAAEQDYQAKACAEVRKAKLYKKSKKSGLRLSVSIPPMTFNALSVADPELRNIDKSEWLKQDGSNDIVQALERTFPEYRVAV